MTNHWPCTRRAVRPWLALSLVLLPASAARLSATELPNTRIPVTHVCRAATMDLQRLLLQPTQEARGASGSGVMIPAASPFGIAITGDGHLVYDLEVTFAGLGQPGQTAHYVAWIAEPTLIKVIKLGEVNNGTQRFNE